ncbi:MAG: phosphotransferase [Lachnospiraceae bacterium]|nr:phosphotransferase [Lachnospiraceae bacterium]
MGLGMNSYNLGGHSGCQIYLIEDDDGSTFVRKISKDKNYNNRLKIQSEKQAAFTSDAIETPAVLRYGYTDEELYFFDMEYIQGITLAEYIKTMEIGKVKGLVESLVSSLIPKTSSLFASENKLDVSEIFSKKLSGLRSTLSVQNNSIINQALDLLEMHDWSNLTHSQCHGDMTLENIIIKNDKFYFIDFLDSFYDSWFLDVGTLLQDIEIMWSYRFQEKVSMNTVLRLIVFRDLLIDEIKKVNSDFVVEIYYSLLQKLVRIYPYTKDEFTYNFLNEKTNLVIATIKALERTAREDA